MHLTQQQQLNQMCPPPLGPSAAWFMNTHQTSSHPPTGLPNTQTMATSYHNYHQNNNHNHQSHHIVNHHQQNYYDINAGHSILTSPSNTSAQHNSSNTTTTTVSANLAISVNNINVPQHNHLQHQQHSQHHQQHQHQQANYNYPTYHHSQPPQQQQQQQQQLQRSQQHQVTQQQYSSIQHHHHQQHQPLTIQQPQTQHVHQTQQPSPILQQTKPQLSPHAASQPRPSPTLLQHQQHQQPSPNYQQHSPHLTSPSLQPSPVHHHQSQQHSPLSRHQQQTPPHHTPTPLSQHHNSRPASVKEVTSTTTTISQTSSILPTEIRILELNRKLQSRPTLNRNSPLPSNDQYDDLKWWDEFINDYFKDDATLTLLFQIDDKPVKHIIRRTFISKFFRSFFEGGVTEFTINLKSSRELRGNNQSVILECEQASIVTKNILKHPKLSSSPRVLVCTEGRLSLEFVNNGIEPLLIKTFRFQIDHCKEFIDRSLTAIGLANAVLVEPLTFQGLPETTMFFLRMYSILEPMQELMTQQKLTNFEPRACLKKMLFDKFRFMSEDDKINETKRRKRKQPNSPAVPKKSRTTITACNNQVNGTSLPTINNLPPLSIVGEPSLMGEYRDDNERLIKQIENSNHVPPEDIENKPESSSEQGSQVDLEDTIKEEIHEVENQPIDNYVVSEEQTEPEKEVEKLVEDTHNAIVAKDEKLPQSIEESSRPVSEGPSEKETDEEVQATSECQVNLMSSIPEDKEDTFTSKLPVSSISKSISTNGSINNNKQNRRRSSERKETLREGLMRTSDFVVAMKDLKCEHPALWRITTGNNLLQQFEPKTQNGVVLYENTNQYAGWNPEIKRDYIGVDVRLTQHTRNQITVERLLLNFQKLDDAEAFYDKHFAVYLQILISTALDPRFWEGIENDTKHHDYFITSRKIIDETIKRHKLKLANKFKISEVALKNIEKYPNLMIKHILNNDESQPCQNCNTNPSTSVVTFGNKSYDLHSFKSVKVTNGPFKTEDKDLNHNLCDACLALVKLYSEVHHMGWRFYKTALKRVERQPNSGKPLNEVLDECMKDEEWLAKIYAERDSLWLRVEQAE